MSNPSRTPALFFRNAAQVLTLDGPPPRRGRAMNELGVIEDGAVLTHGGLIAAVGRTRSLESAARRLHARNIDCHGRVVMPGFVDCHTHLVFAGSRVEDFEKRIRGETYEQISREGSGIGHTAKLVRRATLDELVAQARAFLRQFAAHGTTTLEVKSGYGLDVAGELKILRAIARLQQSEPLELVPTLLAAHAVPKEFRRRRQAYVRRIIEELIPTVARARLAEFIDVFCDRGAFSVAECRQVLEAGKRAGLVPRVHAEQLSHSGASRLAIELGAASADHVDQVGARDVRALARSNVVAVLLPGSNFNLGLKEYPPARKLIDACAAVALATDFNPGTSPTLNMQFILSLACTQMRMTPAEAISAATVNAAYSLGRAGRVGSLAPGRQADLAIMDVDDYRKIPYFFARNHCVVTVKRGRIVFSRD